jgi:hypothetical protein
MIVSAVADPEAFGPAGIVDKLSRREAMGFLHGIVQNGVLLDSPRKDLLRASIAEAEKLPIGQGQPLRILLEEISKRHKKLVAKCNQTEFSSVERSDLPTKIAKLATVLKADAIITHGANQAEVQSKCGRQYEVVLIEDVSESAYETTRRGFLLIETPIDEMDSLELEELIGRSLRYAATIRIYDYLMARSGNRGPKFLSGIKFFLAIWCKWSIHTNAETLTVELYAVGGRQSATGFIDAQEAIKNLEKMQRDLESVPRVQARFFIKSDSNSIFHTRGLEARGRAMTLDPGFDSIAETGPTRRCLLKLDNAAESHFNDCRKLPDC